MLWSGRFDRDVLEGGRGDAVFLARTQTVPERSDLYWKPQNQICTIATENIKVRHMNERIERSIERSLTIETGLSCFHSHPPAAASLEALL